jgi:ribosomal protein S27E
VPQENVNQETTNNERKEAMSNQPTTIREVNPMKQCKHQVWDWKLIPGQVNTDYKAVYCELCGEQLAQLAPKNKPMTDKQIKFIRSLFLEVKSNMTIDEQESLTTKMKAHIDGTNVLTTKWASAAIDKLKAYKPKPVKPVQVMEEDEPFGKVECHVCGTKYQPEEMGGSGTEVFTNGCIACLY